MRTSSTAARRVSAGRKGASEAGVNARPSADVSLMRTGYLALGLAALVAVVPASLAQDTHVANPRKPVGTAIQAIAQRVHPRLGNSRGISLDVPVGRVWVSPKGLEGEAIYVRRTTAKAGIAIVEVSTTPFMPVSATGAEGFRGAVRPDQPAPW